MDTKQKLQEDLKQSMRAGDEPRKRNIRMVLAATRLAEVEKGSPLDEPGLMVILQKEIKSRRETILDAQKIGRSDLVDVAEVDISILESYLPKPLTQEELVTLAKEAITEVGAKSPADMGKVMKVLLPRLLGRAPGDQASLAVRQLLLNA
jgi:uncharacterized protein YqeY